ncbi:hypothetical protein BDQ17DRAFT_1323167 [Cyathus striatus]|nr:hypothetical protein BDQ17DRAFT_1323167 [Cyathus striatus]
MTVLISFFAVKFERFDPATYAAPFDEKGADYTVLRPTWFQGATSKLLFEIDDCVEKEMMKTSLSSTSMSSKRETKSSPLQKRAVSHSSLRKILLAHEKAAILLSKVLGRKISHKRVSLEDLIAFWKQIGLPEDYAAGLAGLEQRISTGVKEEAFNTIGDKDIKFVGKGTLAEYFKENKDIWAPA